MSEKKNIIMIPNNKEFRNLDDIKPFIDYYQNDFNIFVLTKNTKEDNIKTENFTLVDYDSKQAEYLKYTSDYTIDTGVLSTPYKISDSQFWCSIWHGIPYEKVCSDNDYSNINQCLDYSNIYNQMISSSNHYSDTFLTNALMFNSKIIETGRAKIDQLINSSKQDIIKIKEKLNIPLDTNIVLYAPAYRKQPFDDLNFDIDKFISNLETKTKSKWLLILRLENKIKTKQVQSTVIDLSNHPSENELMLISDVLISDYHPLIIDYALLKKPIYLYQFDQAEYLQKHPSYFDYEKYFNHNHLFIEEDKLYDINLDHVEIDYTVIKEDFYQLENGQSTINTTTALNFDSKNRETAEINFLINNLNDESSSHNFIIDFSKVFKEKYNSKINVFAINEFNFEHNSFKTIDHNLVDIAITSETNQEACLAILNQTPGKIIALDDNAYNFYKKNCNRNTNILTINECNDVANCIDNPVEDEVVKWFNFINRKVELIIEQEHVEAEFKPSLLDRVKNIFTKELKHTKPDHKLKEEFDINLINHHNKRVAKDLNINNLEPISIIIIDNIEITLKHQLEMLSKLSNKNLEIIVVTNKKIDKFNDLNIKYLSFESDSIAQSRTKAIAQASSDYIYFLGNNETLSDYGLELMLHAAIKRNAQIVSANTIIDNKDNNKIYFINKDLYENGKIFNDKLNNEYFRDSYYFNKLYAKELLIENKELLLNSFDYDNTLNLILLNKATTLINIPYTTSYLEQYNNNYDNLNILLPLSLDSLIKRIELLSIELNTVNDNYKPYLISSFINNDMLIYLRNYDNYSEKERKDIFDLLQNFLQQYQYYYFISLNRNSRNNRLYSYLIEDNFIGFDKLAHITSVNFHNEYLPVDQRL